MNPALVAARAGLSRGRIEVTQTLTTPADLIGILIPTGGFLAAMIWTRYTQVPGTHFSLGTTMLVSVLGLNVVVYAVVTMGDLLVVEREDGTLLRAKATPNGMTGYLIGSFEQPEEVYKIGQQSVRVLLAFGDLIVAWLLARQAEIAGRALENADALTEQDRDFYTGKLAAARFFTTTVLPRLESDRRILEETTNDLMSVPEGAF